MSLQEEIDITVNINDVQSKTEMSAELSTTSKITDLKKLKMVISLFAIDCYW